MKRVLVGLDLNGRADVAARDISLDDLDTLLDDPLVISGGMQGGIVRAGKDWSRRIAGPQAFLAPHGRGGGWGRIGERHLRRPLATALDAPETEGGAADIRSAVEALARGARTVVIAVPDLPDFDEARQGRLIRAVRDRRGPDVRLLWRPVAAFLDLLADGSIPQDAIGSAWDILVHGPEGLEHQRLTLVQDVDHPGHVAPRRDGFGTRVLPALGLDALLQRAREAVMRSNSSIVWERCEETRLGAGLLSGAASAGEVEILRTWNNTWTAVTAPALSAKSLWADTLSVPQVAAGATGSFLITPLAATLALDLAHLLQPSWPGVKCASHAAIARGALRAGRLIERGLPHYFDRIEPIRIAIQREEGPVWDDLIPADLVVAADREYVSPPLEDFAWPKGKAQVEFYILKGAQEVRHWKAEKDKGPDRAQPVTLRVRQTPGQSWARLSVTSQAWDDLDRAPILLDWETIAPLDASPDEVLEALRSPPPTIPNLVVEASHAALWLGGDWAGGGDAARYAKRELSGQLVAMSIWADTLRAPRIDPADGQRYWHLSTDGTLPDGLPGDVIEGFQLALARFEKTVVGAAPLADNKALMAATWCHTLCPEPVKDALVTAWEAHGRRQPHRLLGPAAAISVVKQGAGRAVTGEGRIRRLLELIVASNLNHHDVNALAMILSRRDEAPDAMTRQMVDSLAPRLALLLLNLQLDANFQQRFRATIQALAGLFRWRVRERHALLSARDPVAQNLRTTLDDVHHMLRRPEFAQVPALPRKLEIVEKLIAYLDGHGDPDILTGIQAS